MQALILDVKNYEAFRELVEGSMMSATEGESNIAPPNTQYSVSMFRTDILQSGSSSKLWRTGLSFRRNSRISSS